MGDTGLVTDIGEISVTVVLEKYVVIVREVGVDDIETAVVQIIVRSDAHVGRPRVRFR